MASPRGARDSRPCNGVGRKTAGHTPIDSQGLRDDFGKPEQPQNERAAATAIANGSQERPLAGLSVSTAAETATLAYRSAVALGELLVDLPLPTARAIVRGMAEAVDTVRIAEGRPAGMVEAITVEVVAPVEPDLPDFLKDRSDWRADLMRAWSALPQEDRLAFVARATGERRAA